METKKVQTLNVQNPTREPRVSTEVAVRDKPKRELNSAQRLAQVTRDNKVERFLQQEAKRAVPIQVDQPGVLWGLVALVAVSFISAAIITANGTVAVATNMKLGDLWFSFLVFGAIEVGILGALGMYLVTGSRPNPENPTQPIKATQWFVLMCVLAGVTAANQAFHVLQAWNFAWAEPGMWAGIILSIVVALMYVLLSKGLSTVVFARAIFLNAPALGRPRKES